MDDRGMLTQAVSTYFKNSVMNIIKYTEFYY